MLTMKTRRPHTVLGLALTFAASLSAQSDASAAQRALARAIVLEEHERDLGAARVAYEALAKSPDPEVRSAAAARLVKLQEKLTASRPASRGDQALFQRALDRLGSPDEAVAQAGIGDIVFLGERAVPLLAGKLSDPETERLVITRGAAALLKLGSPSAVAALTKVVETGSQSVQRAAYRGFFGPNNQWLFTGAAQGVAHALLKAAEPGLKVEMLSTIGSFFTIEELCAELEPKQRDLDFEIRIKALAGLAILKGDQIQLDTVTAKILGPVTRMLEEDSEHAALPVLRFGYGGTEAWRALYMRALAVWAPLPNGMPTAGPQRLDSRGFRALVEIATKTPLPEGVNNGKRQLIEQTISETARSLGREGVESAIALCGSNYRQSELLTLIAKHIEDGHVPALVHAALTSANWELLGMVEKRPTLPPTVLGDLIAILEGPARGSAGPTHRVLDLVARLRTKEAVHFLLERAQKGAKETGGGYDLVEPLLRAASDPVLPEAEAALCQALEIENLSNGELLWARLMEMGSKAAIELYPRYLGTYGSRTTREPSAELARRGGSFNSGGLSWLFVRDPSGKPFHKYPEADVARILELCWNDTQGAGRKWILGMHQSLLSFPKATIEMLCRRPPEPSPEAVQFVQALLELVTPVDQEWSDAALSLCAHVAAVGERQCLNRLGTALFSRAKRASPKLRALLETLLDQPLICNSALFTLGRFDAPAAVAAARARLAHPEPLVRTSSRYYLIEQLGKAAIPEFLPAASEKDAPTRRSAAVVLGKHADRRGVPALLTLLRDPDAEVAAAAKLALEKIRFVEEQEEFWRRLTDAAPVDAQSAAEALLKQTGKNQPRVVRLAAIDALGTLAVPETLPFLIELMKDADAELAAHATAALEKIHAKKR